eukprot:3234843-Prymnesium_polylepis.1
MGGSSNDHFDEEPSFDLFTSPVSPPPTPPGSPSEGPVLDKDVGDGSGRQPTDVDAIMEEDVCIESEPEEGEVREDTGRWKLAAAPRRREQRYDEVADSTHSIRVRFGVRVTCPAR